MAQALDPDELPLTQATTPAPTPAPALASSSPAAGLDRRVVIGGWILAAATAIGAIVLVLQIAAQRDAPAVIKIEWPADERSQASYEISGSRGSTPKGAAPLVFKVVPGPHRVVLRRPGFAPVSWEFTLFAAEERVLKPAWERVEK